MITLTRADSGKTVEIRPGDTVVMCLDENPTTGYQWALESNQEEVVTLLSTDYVPARGVGIGGGGQRLFTFKAVQTGDTTLHFRLWRAWEGDTSIQERFFVTLQISE
jgi:inhibitor of cysteine peptidase